MPWTSERRKQLRYMLWRMAWEWILVLLVVGVILFLVWAWD